ncbi:MAG: type I methionyl aminopeptidase [Lentisphaeria bacterium]|nr:type I methionyl aminopeptidase [Lentisphaeria bacterium]
MRENMRPDFIIHTPEEIVRIKHAAAKAAQVRERICSLVRSGMTTWDLDELAGEVIRASGGVPTFLGYRGFPGNICISINDEVVHGIRSRERFILNGDVVSIDVGVTFEGCVGDTAKTIYVGDDIPPDIERLLKFTESALECGLAAAHPGGYVQDISRGVEMEAKRGRLGIVEEYVGHGCGTKMHEPPDVPNYVQHRRGPMLQPGMVLCVEPMLNLGSKRVYVESDGWTVRTRDGEPSAHFEHMLLIAETGTEVLTRV